MQDYIFSNSEHGFFLFPTISMPKAIKRWQWIFVFCVMKSLCAGCSWLKHDGNYSDSTDNSWEKIWRKKKGLKIAEFKMNTANFTTGIISETD